MDYVFALAIRNLRGMAARPGQTLGMAAAMGVQDLLLFAAWIVFFRAVGVVRGWSLSEVCLMYGLLFLSFCFSQALTDGVRTLGRRIETGEFDIYLSHPRSPLATLVFSQANPGNFGDMAAGLVLLATGAGLTPSTFVLALACAFLVGMLFHAATLVYHSLTFYVAGGSRTAEYLTDSVYYLGLVPQEGHGPVMRSILFSILPAGFMVLTPVHLIRNLDLPQLGLLAIAVGLYWAVALLMFAKGVERYKAALR